MRAKMLTDLILSIGNWLDHENGGGWRGQWKEGFVLSGRVILKGKQVIGFWSKTRFFFFVVQFTIELCTIRWKTTCKFWFFFMWTLRKDYENFILFGILINFYWFCIDFKETNSSLWHFCQVLFWRERVCVASHSLLVSGASGPLIPSLFKLSCFSSAASLENDRMWRMSLPALL